MDKKHIEALRSKAKSRLDAAKTAEEVKEATEDLANLDEIEKEANELIKTNSDLLASYKEIIKSESVAKSEEVKNEDDDALTGLDFDEALKKVLANRKEEK